MKELIDFIQQPNDDITAYNLAEWYYSKEDYAGSISFYIRVCEVSKDDNRIYKSLIKIALALYKQSWRITYVKGYLLHAISVLPKRPEGYYLLAKIYEENKEWQECYSMCEIAKSICDFSYVETDLEYPGHWGFDFEKSVASWWMGREKESIDLSTYLYENVEMPEMYKNAVIGNINLVYGTLDYQKPTYKDNYSQAFQDLFVLLINEYKRDGKYLEIGAYHPYEHSNTYLLEKEYNWKGISLDINPKSVVNFNAKRFNECIEADATRYNYKEKMDSLGWGTDWDYLQLDCEPSANTFLALMQIPLDDYRFRVITYEHDWYLEKSIYKDKSRRYLESMGYELIVSNVSVDNKSPFEDWWVHKELISNDIKDKFRSIKEINHIKEYIFNYI
jgi:hypothetical protein